MPKRRSRSTRWKRTSVRRPFDMSSLDAIADLLRNVALDRRTKLQILDILAANSNPKAAEDIETLLRSYEQMDAQGTASLSKRLEEIQAAYQKKVDASMARVNREARVLQDEVQRNEEIERIRQSLDQ